MKKRRTRNCSKKVSDLEEQTPCNCFISDERDEYDDEFDRMRAANLKTRLIAAKDEHTEAVKTVASCRDKLAHARQQACHASNFLVSQTFFFAGAALERSCGQAVRRETQSLPESSNACGSCPGNGHDAHWQTTPQPATGDKS